jgi:CHAD domain-containing protein
MGPQGWLVDSGKVTFKDIQPRLGAIQDAKAMLDELTRAVRSGAFKSDQAFVTQYNSMVQQLESK